MEHRPPNPDDRVRDVPELERLYRGEIDLTGVVQQDDSLRDVIGDAIGEAEADGSEVPDWGARTLARALANERDDPMSGALHHFAVTGLASPEAMAAELADLYQLTTDEEIHEWINWLGTYVINLPESEALSDQQQPSEPQLRTSSSTELPAGNTSLEKTSAFLHLAFARADARGEAIMTETAQTIAAMFGAILGSRSEMACFADTGDANPARLHEECQLLKRHNWQTAEAGIWLQRFEQHLAARSDLGWHATALPTSESDLGDPPAVQGIREHGEAFWAYLTLPNVDPNQTELLVNFQHAYIGSFDSMYEMVDALVDIQAATEAIKTTAEGWGLADYVSLDHEKLQAMARESWDIAEAGGRLHAFMK